MESMESVLVFALESLKEIVVYYSDLICGTKDRVDDLCRQLDTLKGFIEVCTEKYNKRGKNKFLEGLVNEVKRVVFEAEDAIETYIVTASLQNSRGLLSKIGHAGGYVSDLKDVADQIQRVSAKVHQFYAQTANLALDIIRDDEIQSGSTLKKKDLAVVEDNTVIDLLEDKLEELIKLLETESENLEVISITGTPGLGKTTLAKRVKNLRKIDLIFGARAFIRVSQQYEEREVFLDLLGQLNPAPVDMNNKSDQDIVHAIHKAIEDYNKSGDCKPYLIVVDDVWTTEAWDYLKRAFPDTRNSKVLMTTRQDEVACHANPVRDPVRLRRLNDEESRKLLRTKVFGRDSCTEGLKEYEQRIISKCDGLPLSIVVVAGYLRTNKGSTRRWEKAAENVNVYVAQDETSRGAIRLSFNDLPPHLKLCFLYLGAIHEGFKIPVWKLLRLWIAEGFVVPQGDSRLEVIAEDYLEELVARNLVEVVEKRANGQIKSCRLLDAVRDFCKEEAKKQILFREIKMYGEPASSSTPNDYYRRLCINSHVAEYIFTNPSKGVRSLLISLSEEQVITNAEVLASSFFRGFKLLRVLDVRSAIFPDFPMELLYLIFLRYVAISSDLRTLPKEVSGLRSLQTVIITKSWGPIEINPEIWKMPQLRHLETNTSLYCPAAKSSYADYLMISFSLQTLSRVSTESCTVDMFKRILGVKKLAICGKLETNLFENLSCLKLLENLKLINESRMCALPASEKFPEKLRKLTLQNTLLDSERISVLANLKNLEALKLNKILFRDAKWRIMDERFGLLQVLHIGDSNLEIWEATEKNFPVLRWLIIRDCRKLQDIPLGIGHITSLQSIALSGINNNVAQTAERIEKLKRDLHKGSNNSEPLNFHLSVVASKHPDVQSTNDDEEECDDDQTSRRSESRLQAPQQTEVLENPKEPRRSPWYKRLFHLRSKVSDGKNPKNKATGL